MSNNSAEEKNQPVDPTIQANNHTEQQQEPVKDLVKQLDVYDTLLSKYIAVWLWSIIFGAVTGIFYSFITYRSYGERVYLLTVFATMTTIIGLVAAIFSSYSLYTGLVKYLIPKFFLNEEVDAKILGNSLKNAFSMLILALIIRLFLSLFEVILASLMF